ncbi:Gfo/Idh/MocA family protein [Streptomyces sp. JNUCC 64]
MGIRVGIVGLGGMGRYLADWCGRTGLEVVALCERDPGRLAEAAAEHPDAEPTTRWRELLAPRLALDAVVLAHDFDAHAPLAVAFLDRGVHVLSESAACADETEGRLLIAAADRSTATYSFAENYVLHPHVRLVRAAADAGELGRITLVEADYLHALAPDQVSALIGDPDHWRGRIASTAYCTHTLSPVLALTGARPVEVSAFPVDAADPRSAVVMTVRLSTGALAVTRHGFLQGEPDSHWSWISARGTRGLAESVRAPGERAWSVRVRAEGWTRTDGTVLDEERVPPPVALDDGPVERRAEGTALLLRAFRDTVEHGAPPLVPVRDAVAASLVGVAGARSLAEGSRPVPVPDVSGDGDGTPSDDHG